MWCVGLKIIQDLHFSYNLAAAAHLIDVDYWIFSDYKAVKCRLKCVGKENKYSVY